MWSQFEAINARNAFPGFDPRGYKTPFTIAAPPGGAAVSNAPQLKVIKTKRVWNSFLCYHQAVADLSSHLHERDFFDPVRGGPAERAAAVRAAQPHHRTRLRSGGHAVCPPGEGVDCFDELAKGGFGGAASVMLIALLHEGRKLTSLGSTGSSGVRVRTQSAPEGRAMTSSTPDRKSAASVLERVGDVVEILEAAEGIPDEEASSVASLVVADGALSFAVIRSSIFTHHQFPVVSRIVGPVVLER